MFDEHEMYEMEQDELNSLARDDCYEDSLNLLQPDFTEAELQPTVDYWDKVRRGEVPF